MERQFERNDSVIEFQKYHSGCLRGMLHLKRILPRRKHGTGKYPMCCRNPKTHSLEHDTQEVPGYPNVDAVTQLVDEEETIAKEIERSSSKARMNALIAKEMSGRQGSLMQSGLQTSWFSPIIIVQRNSDSDSTGWQAPLSEKIDESAAHQPEVRRLDRQTSGSKFKESVDILEIFQVNKKLFLEILREPDVQGVKRIHFQHSSTPKLKIKRSDSFPAAKPSGTRSLRPTTLEHKKTETWSFPTAEDTCLASNGIGNGKSEIAAIRIQEEAASCSHELPQGLSRSGRYSSVMSYVAGLKKKIKHALKRSEKVSDQTIINELLVGISSEFKFPEDDGAKTERSGERSHPSNDLEKDGVRLVRRTCSLNNSIDKYTWLSDNSFSRETAPRFQYRSRSLKLTSDDRNLSRASSMKTFRRRLSLPDDIDSLLLFPVEASRDQSEPPKHEEQTAVGETDNVEDRASKAVELHQELVETCQDEQPASSVNSIAEDEDRSSVSVLDIHFQANTFGSIEPPKGKCLKSSNTSAGQLDRTMEASSTRLCADAESGVQNNPDWTYVRDVLYVSGFLEQDRLAPWHSLEQPVSPKLYNELEAFLHRSDQQLGHDGHRLVFDLVNEILLDVFGSQLTYFPMQRPLPKGIQVLSQVWKRISWYQNYGSWLKDRAINDIVERDFSKGDGWINLRFRDVEDVALDLEDAIFDELLDELIFE